MTKLLHELERTGGRYGLQTMCEGGGQANATIIERLLTGSRRPSPAPPRAAVGGGRQEDAAVRRLAAPRERPTRPVSPSRHDRT